MRSILCTGVSLDFLWSIWMPRNWNSYTLDIVEWASWTDWPLRSQSLNMEILIFPTGRDKPLPLREPLWTPSGPGSILRFFTGSNINTKCSTSNYLPQVFLLFHSFYAAWLFRRLCWTKFIMDFISSLNLVTYSSYGLPSGLESSSQESLIRLRGPQTFLL